MPVPGKDVPVLRRLALALLGAILMLGSGLALAAGEPQIFTIARFAFESGKTLDNMRVAYDTYGELNAARDNAILVTHGASGGRNGYKVFIGPGKAFDTNKYFVVTVDAIGGGGSSKPADGLDAAFPDYTIRDMVRAQNQLLTEGLRRPLCAFRWNRIGCLACIVKQRDGPEGHHPDAGAGGCKQKGCEIAASQIVKHA